MGITIDQVSVEDLGQGRNQRSRTIPRIPIQGELQMHTIIGGSLADGQRRTVDIKTQRPQLAIELGDFRLNGFKDIWSPQFLVWMWVSC